MTPAVTIEELLGWSDESTRHWLQFLAANPAAQQLPCDIYAAGDVLGLVRHIVGVELRFYQRLASLPVTPWDEVPEPSLAQLASRHTETTQRLYELLADPSQDWDAPLEFTTRTAGTLRATRRKIFAHLLLHAIRHWAQLATLSRSAGFPSDFKGDLLLSPALA